MFAAHSLGCIAIARWAEAEAGLTHKVKGALLVAPADVDRNDTPQPLKNFGPIPKKTLPFSSTVVASRNDPYVSAERAKDIARAWGSRFVDIGRAGHVNGDSGLAGREAVAEVAGRRAVSQTDLVIE